MKVMLDSDTCIYLMNGRPEVVAKEDLHECCISSVVMGELEFGHLNSKRKVENRAKLELLLGNLTVVEVGEAEAKAYADVRLSVQKQTIGPNDLWIAAHAIALDLPLVTNNTREFSRVPGLAVTTWLKD